MNTVQPLNSERYPSSLVCLVMQSLCKHDTDDFSVRTLVEVFENIVIRLYAIEAISFL